MYSKILKWNVPDGNSTVYPENVDQTIIFVLIYLVFLLDLSMCLNYKIKTILFHI